ncbi:MAG: type II toxin-antitoxin system RelB/DinJ family antitoxin [Desulfovibrio sp.]
MLDLRSDFRVCADSVFCPYPVSAAIQRISHIAKRPCCSYIVAINCNILPEGANMSQDAVIRARVNREVKEKAAAVLAAMGLTISDMMRMTLIKVAQEKALPFDPSPNEETIAAMRELDDGKGKRFSSADDLFSELGV